MDDGLEQDLILGESDFDKVPPSSKEIEIEQEKVDEKTLALFREKSEFILHKTVFDFTEIYLRDFISLVFERDGGEGSEVEPFEEKESAEYLLWRELKKERDAKHKEGEPLPKIDYSGYAMWRYNPIVLYRTKKDGKLINEHSQILKDDWRALDFFESRQFAIASPITYVGKNRYAKNARYLYAFAFDLDGVGIKQLRDVIHQSRTDAISRVDGKIIKQHSPQANIIVNSGHGLHLYFLLETPVALYKENIPLLRKMKMAMTNVLWNEFTSSLKDKQYQGIFQGFRLPGTLTKFGEKIRAFHNTDAPRYTLRELNSYLGSGMLSDQELKQLEGKAPYNPVGVTLDEAKRQWPDWYEKVVVCGDKRPKKWHIKRDLYDWWLRRLRDPNEDIVQGHRYFCLLALAIYAEKCDIDESELRTDAYSLLKRMDDKTDDEDNHFTEQDIEDALMGYKIYYCTFPRNSIKYLTGLDIKENRRNGRKQVAHLARARAVQQFDDPEGSWRGRPKGAVSTTSSSRIAKLIRKWILDHPENHNKAQCARDVTDQLRDIREKRVERGKAKKVAAVSRATIHKWWAIVQQELWEEMVEDYKSMLKDEEAQNQVGLASEKMLEAMTVGDD